MVDRGLLLSGAVIVALLYAAGRWMPAGSFERSELLDRLLWPVLAGVLAGRAVAAALDDPTSLGSLRAFLVIRGGVEFWPGVAVAAGVLAVGWRRRRPERGPERVLGGLALLAPLLLLAYAGYEATCILRDGCYGPASPVGLVPDGLQTRQFPVGLVVAGGVVALAWLLSSWPAGPGAKVLAAVGGVAAVRALASIWLPHLGGSLTRQHLESIGVAVAVAMVASGVWLRARSRGRAGRSAPAAATAEPATAPGQGAAL